MKVSRWANRQAVSPTPAAPRMPGPPPCSRSCQCGPADCPGKCHTSHPRASTSTPARASNGVFPVGDDYDVAALHYLVKLKSGTLTRFRPCRGKYWRNPSRPSIAAAREGAEFRTGTRSRATRVLSPHPRLADSSCRRRRGTTGTSSYESPRINARPRPLPMAIAELSSHPTGTGWPGDHALARFARPSM